jgi:hypothetical protein
MAIASLSRSIGPDALRPLWLAVVCRADASSVPNLLSNTF